MSRRASLRTLANLASQLTNTLDHNSSIVSGNASIQSFLGIAAGVVLASAAAATTAWSAAADPSTPIPGPASQPEPAFSSNEGTAQWRVFTDIARDLVREGRQDEAERYLKRALEAARRGFGDKDPHVASACQNLAEVYRLQKKYDLAGPLYDEALAILGETYGPRDIRVAFALHNVAGYYVAQRDWDKAAQYYDQALQVKLASVGPGHMETSNTLFHLAEVRFAQGRKKEAVQLARRSLDVMEQGGASEAATVRRRTRLGEMLMEQGQPAEAEVLFRKVLNETAVEGVGRVPAAENLAKALKELGRFDEARELLEDSIKRRKEHGGAEHPSTAAALRRLAEVNIAAAVAQKDPRPAAVAGLQLDAVEQARQAVEIAEKAYKESIEAAAARQDIIAKSGKSGAQEPEEKSWYDRFIPGRQQNSNLSRVLRAVRPEIAALELSSCLTTQALVKHALREDLSSILDDLERALVLVTSEWPGKDGTKSVHHSKMEELRDECICRVLTAQWEIQLEAYGKNAQVKQSVELLKKFKCQAPKKNRK